MSWPCQRFADFPHTICTDLVIDSISLPCSFMQCSLCLLHLKCLGQLASLSRTKAQFDQRYARQSPHHRRSLFSHDLYQSIAKCFVCEAPYMVVALTAFYSILCFTFFSGTLWKVFTEGFYCILSFSGVHNESSCCSSF